MAERSGTYFSATHILTMGVISLLYLTDFYQELLVLYLIAGAGYIAKQKGIFSKHADSVLTNLILYITLPALIVFSLDVPFSFQLAKDFGILILFSIFVLSTSCLIAFLFAHKLHLNSERKGVYQGIVIFGNQGFLGYAICQMLFPEDGVMYTVVFNIVYLILIWTYGIYIVAKDRVCLSWKSLWLNPGIVATLLGLVIFLVPVELPELFRTFFQRVGSPTTPLSMLLIGSLMADLELRGVWEVVRDKTIWSAMFFKLLMIPALLIPFSFIPVKFTVLAVAVLVSAMPSAPTISLYAQKYGGDSTFSSIGTCISTLLLPVTLPFLYYLLSLAFSY